jgi:hypothetical protein
MANPTINNLDFLKGALAEVSLCPWASGGTPSNWTPLGALREVKVDGGRDVKIIEADNALWALDAYYSKAALKAGFKIMQADLLKLAQSIGNSSSDVVVAGGVASFPIDELVQLNYYSLLISVAGQSMKPGANTYIRRTVTLYKGILHGKIDMILKRDQDVETGVEFEALLDTSIAVPTYGASTKGRIGTIADSTT